MELKDPAHNVEPGDRRCLSLRSGCLSSLKHRLSSLITCTGSRSRSFLVRCRHARTDLTSHTVLLTRAADSEGQSNPWRSDRLRKQALGRCVNTRGRADIGWITTPLCCHRARQGLLQLPCQTCTCRSTSGRCRWQATRHRRGEHHQGRPRL